MTCRECKRRLQPADIAGRPDLSDQSWWRQHATWAKRHPPFIYSARGTLIHRLAGIEFWWYQAYRGGGCHLVRLNQPRAFFLTMCTLTFQQRHARVCRLAAPAATHCRRCNLLGFATWPRGAWGPERRAAAIHLGCAPPPAADPAA